jgi:hypothetical protein
MNRLHINKVTEQLKVLPDDCYQPVLTFVIALSNRRIQGVPGKRLLKYAGIISEEEAAQMVYAIEADCRRMDRSEW